MPFWLRQPEKHHLIHGGGEVPLGPGLLGQIPHGSPCRSSGERQISPGEGLDQPQRPRSSVDLPEPLSPTMQR